MRLGISPEVDGHMLLQKIGILGASTCSAVKIEIFTPAGMIAKVEMQKIDSKSRCRPD